TRIRSRWDIRADRLTTVLPTDPTLTPVYTLSLHDALPISMRTAVPWSPPEVAKPWRETRKRCTNTACGPRANPIQDPTDTWPTSTHAGTMSSSDSKTTNAL